MNNRYEDIACCKALYEDLLDGKVVYNEMYNCFHYPYSRVFAYCPNCGAKLPDYSTEYDEALEEALGKEYCDITEDEIPEEFKTDEWWRKREIKGIGKYWEMYNPIKMNSYE